MNCYLWLSTKLRAFSCQLIAIAEQEVSFVSGSVTWG